MMGRRGRRHKKLLDDRKKNTGYQNLKEEAKTDIWFERRGCIQILHCLQVRPLVSQNSHINLQAPCVLYIGQASGTRILVPSSSQPGHCGGIEGASTYAGKKTSQQLSFNYDLSLEWPKPSSAASSHTPQPAVLFVDSEFASVSTYNVQGPCGADQTTIPRPPVTPSGA